MKRTILTLLILSVWFLSFSFAAKEPDFEIIPEKSNTNIWTTVKNIWEWWKVWEKYKDTAYGAEIKSNGRTSRPWGKLSLWDQFASWVMTWDTILDYAVYLVKFVWQLALLAGALMIIYYGYKKATEHLKFDGTLWKVVTWILVISFAYVIVKIIWSMFIS